MPTSLPAELRSPRTDAALALLRTVAGVVFIAHGIQKFFLMGIPGVTQYFAGLGAPLPQVTAPLVATLELAGGIALILGLFTRPIALALVGDMLGAIVLQHLKGGFWVPNGVEFVMTLGGAAAALALAGGGRYSLDQLLRRRR